MGGLKTTIMVIGQDVRRQLIDVKEENVLIDENNYSWLDIKFDTKPLVVKQITEEFSLLKNLISALADLNYSPLVKQSVNQLSQRIILQVGDSHKIIRSNQDDDYLWQEPEFLPQAIVLLESAQLSDDALASLLNYLIEYPEVKLIVEYCQRLVKNDFGQQLLMRAQLLWCDLISHQTAETENIINQLSLEANQFLLVNHNSGISLSDSHRSYKLLTNNKSSLTWLAIAIKALEYDCDVQDSLVIIKRLMTIVDLSIDKQPDFSLLLQKLAQDYSDLTLIRGKENDAKQRRLLVAELLSAKRVLLDLTQSDDDQAVNLLNLRGLSHHVKAIFTNQQFFPSVVKNDSAILVGSQYHAHQQKTASIMNEQVIQFKITDYPTSDLINLIKIKLDFVLSSAAPSSGAIETNINQALMLIKHAIKRQHLIFVSLKLNPKSSFMPTPAIVASEYLRITGQLALALKSAKLDFDQILLGLDLTQLIQDKFNAIDFLQAIANHPDYIDQSLPSMLIDVTSDSMAWLKASQQIISNRLPFALILSAQNYQDLLASSSTESQSRIVFSQFLIKIND